MKPQSERAILVMILLWAAVLRLGWDLLIPALLVSDFAWFIDVANSLVSGDGYQINGLATTRRPHVYPLFVAGVYTLFGASLRAALISIVLLGIITVYLTYKIARLGFTTLVTLGAAMIVASTPSLVLYSGILASENLVIALLLGSLGIYLEYQNSFAPWRAITAGILLGLAILTRPILLIAPAVWIGILMIRQQPREWIALQGFLMIAAVGLTLLPWVVHNWLIHDRFIPLSTDFGSVLLISFNSESRGSYIVPLIHQQIADQATESGWDEYKTSQRMRREAVRWVVSHPLQTLLLATRKLRYTFGDDVSGVSWSLAKTGHPVPAGFRLGLLSIAQAFYVLLFLFAAYGLLDWKSLRNNLYHWVLFATLIGWIFIYIFLFGSDRYHLPVLPIIAIYTAYGASRFVVRWKLRFPSGMPAN